MKIKQTAFCALKETEKGRDFFKNFAHGVYHWLYVWNLMYVKERYLQQDFEPKKISSQEYIDIISNNKLHTANHKLSFPGCFS